MRVKITLACTECKQRNYNMMKEKKNHPERMETKKYCRLIRCTEKPSNPANQKGVSLWQRTQRT